MALESCDNATCACLLRQVIIGGTFGIKLSKGKNQHFVPRHYLKRFSFDGGTRIRLFNLTSGKFVPNAPLKTQCSADYFYSKDPKIESGISDLESAAESHFSEICDSLDIHPAKHEDLLIILLMMKGRTRQSAESINLKYEAVGKEIYRRRQLIEGKEVPKFFDRLRLREESAALSAFRHNVLAYPVVLDLVLKLILAPKGCRFFTSDHPVVILNQAFYNTANREMVSGIASKGIQLFMPLSPELLIFAFDHGMYRVGKPDRRVLKLGRAEDCDLINSLQIMNAEQNVYFQSEDDAQSVRKLLFRFRVQRAAVQKSDHPVLVSGDGMAPSFIKMPSPVVPVPGIWSFCKVRGLATPSSFGTRDPEWCAIYEQYSKDTAEAPKPFDTWLEEQRIKREHLSRRRPRSGP